MYKEIEDLYKKNSPYNRIRRFTLIIYIPVTITMFILYFFKLVLVMPLCTLITIAVLKTGCEKILKTKLFIKFRKKTKNEIMLYEIIYREEKKIFKRHMKKNGLYNEKSLLCIINHYRNRIKPKIPGENLLTIFSIFLPIIMSFYKNGSFSAEEFINAMIYIIIFSIFIGALYYMYNQFIEMKKFIKGEDGIYERLEEIFSELYIECINSRKQSKLTSKRNVRK